MSYIMVDVESDGPIPGDFSLVCFGARCAGLVMKAGGAALAVDANA